MFKKKDDFDDLLKEPLGDPFNDKKTQQQDNDLNLNNQDQTSMSQNTNDVMGLPDQNNQAHKNDMPDELHLGSENTDPLNSNQTSAASFDTDQKSNPIQDQYSNMQQNDPDHFNQTQQKQNMQQDNQTQDQQIQQNQGLNNNQNYHENHYMQKEENFQNNEMINNGYQNNDIEPKNNNDTNELILAKLDLIKSTIQHLDTRLSGIENELIKSKKDRW